MDFGIAVATAADSWRVVQRSEALGFTHARSSSGGVYLGSHGKEIDTRPRKTEPPANQSKQEADTNKIPLINYRGTSPSSCIDAPTRKQYAATLRVR
jgi:hypothetical protein